jgi:hypothetical protein
VGGDVRLELPEQGVNGWGRVEALEDRPEIATGPGRVVTGWFRHELGVVGDLGIEGEAEPLGVTAGHPFWSSDRHGWVPVGELREGERLRAADGSTPEVESFTPRPEPEPVYNIEVEGDHCYRVGQQGLLVHNASSPCGSLSAGFTNRTLTVHATITVNVPQVDPPAGHTGAWTPAPASTYVLTIPKTVTVKLDKTNLSNGSKPNREIKWAITNTGNPDRIGYIVPGNQPKSDTVGHIVDRQFQGTAKHDDDGNRNVFAQNSSFNDDLWNKFMKKVKETIEHIAVCSVCLQYKFTFLSKKYPYRPSETTISWWVEAPTGTTVSLGSLEESQTISNKIGGP